MRSVADTVRLVSAVLEGDVVVKFRPQPKKKPPRRKSPGSNKSMRSDYMKEYMRQYRQDGKVNS